MSLTDSSKIRGVAARARALLMTPHAEWEVIAGEAATVRGLYNTYVLLMAAIPPVCTAIGRILFGYLGGSMWAGLHASPVGAIIVAIITYALSLGSVYVMGLLIEAIAPSFGGTRDRMQGMKVAAYFPTAAWVAGVFGLIPALAALTILGLYSLYLLYLGLPRLMRAPQDKALAFAIVVILAAIVVQMIIATLVGAVSVSLFASSMGVAV